MGEELFLSLLPDFDALAGQHVIVRPYREEDASPLFAAIQESRPHLRPWLPWADQHQRLEETRDWINRQRAAWLLRDIYNCAVISLADGQLLGGISLKPHDWQARVFEIGYWLRVTATGRGYMTEAVQLLTTFAFEQLVANRVFIRCDERNERSAAIPRRLGFVCEGCLRHESLAPDGKLRNTLVFALTSADYRQSRQ
ncbi:GNAT family N-acetyltransferase [Thermogemmatispora sp.]|uniref:GNAT family N-acetyltransferase n=1 Tax=Thermogemmatispora sp. TaxID=1968838 RepID=UPI001D2EE94A|nr:GNAT family N-acetyltransferase [Thermogemmatispora sp.]MBX5450947.1 GNAT family N-acetyltransferase [Thermogemmatispora sp.]